MYPLVWYPLAMCPWGALRWLDLMRTEVGRGAFFCVCALRRAKALKSERPPAAAAAGLHAGRPKGHVPRSPPPPPLPFSPPPAAGAVVPQGRVLDVFHYSAGINACAKGRQWEQALLLLDAMARNGVPPDCVCFNGAISACARGGRWDRALGLLDEMKSKGLAPNMISYSAAISACAKGGCWERALALLAEMRAAGHWPNVITYSAAISACDKGWQWERALGLLQVRPNEPPAPLGPLEVRPV